MDGGASLIVTSGRSVENITQVAYSLNVFVYQLIRRSVSDESINNITPYMKIFS